MHYIALFFLLFTVSCSSGGDSSPTPDPTPPNPPSGDSTETFTFAFTAAEGWQYGFADYPVNPVADFELDGGFRTLPPPLNNQSGLYISGNNRSDDLFMFVKTQVAGLTPAARYDVRFVVSFATQAQMGCSGVGGAPGESVHIKGGATSTEPMAITVGTNYRMNIDKSNQNSSGEDAIVLGNVANSQPCMSVPPSYELKTLNNAVGTLNAVSDNSGRLWVLFGSDSGFEATTSLYYTAATVTFTPY